MVNHLKYQSRKYQGYQGRRAGWYLRRVENKFVQARPNLLFFHCISPQSLLRLTNNVPSYIKYFLNYLPNYTLCN